MDNEQNVSLIRELLQYRPDIDGVFASVERLAISTYCMCRELGCRIPQDIKVIGSSNLEVAGLLDPSLSTITQPAYDIGREAARILLLAVQKKTTVLSSQSVVLKSILFPRRSTART